MAATGPGIRGVLAHPDIPQTTKDDLTGIFDGLDPVALLAEIRLSQARLTKLADEGPQPDEAADQKADVARFLEGLRHAWKEGEVRPTARSKPLAPRERRRPDPLAAVATDLRLWFEQDPSQTGRELLQKLQSAHSGSYPDGLLRTVQRRVKIWRSDMAKALVFADPEISGPDMMATDALRSVGAPRDSGHLEPTEIADELELAGLGTL